MRQPPRTKEKSDFLKSLIRLTSILAGVVVLLIAGVMFLIYQLTADRSPSAIPAPVAVAPEKVPPPAATPASATLTPSEPQIADGKDIETGLVAGEGMMVVKNVCTACHSSDLILQNRFTREGWHEKIVWMQQTQGLWDLGEQEAVILDYLAAHYAPEEFRGRRRPLTNIEWYELQD